MDDYGIASVTRTEWRWDATGRCVDEVREKCRNGKLSVTTFLAVREVTEAKLSLAENVEQPIIHSDACTL